MYFIQVEILQFFFAKYTQNDFHPPGDIYKISKNKN